MKKVAVVMGSSSDMPIAKDAIQTLHEFDVPVTAHILSAHRTPDACAAFARAAEQEGYGVLIALAGKAAHLAGTLASNAVLPVIGVPIRSSDLGGLDALLSTVQMPKGIPVATVAIDGAANAALLAVRILALGDEALARKLATYARTIAEKAAEANLALQKEFNER